MKAHDRSTPHITTVWTGPVRLRTSGLAGRVVAWGVTLLLAASFSIPAWDTPRFLRDVWIGLSERRAVVAPGDGICEPVYRMPFLSCRGTYDFVLDGQRYVGRHDFFILKPRQHPWITADAVYVAGRPDLHTLAQAIEYLPDRAILLVPSLLIIAVVAWAILSEIRFHLKTRRRVGRMRSRPVRLVALPAPSVALVPHQIWGVVFAAFARPARCGRYVLLQPQFSDPYRFPDGRALAAVAPGVPFALIIDKRLKGLGLTREERAELQAALAAASSTHVR